MDRWAIYIDIQGFGALWDKEDQVLRSLGQLMQGIARIGRRCYPMDPERIFAHQFGDGFLIVSDFHEQDLERCLCIAIALLRHVAASGRFAKAAIIEGQMSDITGCYPKEVLNGRESDHIVGLGMGLMTIVPVMGTALIRGVRMESNSPSGPLLLVGTEKVHRLPTGLLLVDVPSKSLTSIDWVHFESDCLKQIQTDAALEAPDASTIESLLLDYLDGRDVEGDTELSEKWRPTLARYLQIACKPRGA